ncbi:MAG: cytochrome c biogenesis protein CcsA [Clostridia bacterium]|nr:cytochrome c biogenesis protein CcsA [Clostridia bacterium]
MTPTVLKLIALLGAICYYSAFVTELLKKKCPVIVSRALWAAGFALNAALVVNNYLVNGYVPFVSMYQVLTFLGVCFLPIWLIMRFLRGSGWMAPYFMFAAGIVMTGLCFMDAESVWEFAPALQSPFFIPHVLVYMISYCMGAVAFILTILSYFVKKRDLHRYEDGIYDCVTVVFPFMTMGMFFGSIWANEIWGHFWSWDTKENFSLITWLIYMLYLHFRRNAKLKKYTRLLALAGFVGIIVTFLFANVLNTGSVHSYSS